MQAVWRWADESRCCRNVTGDLCHVPERTSLAYLSLSVAGSHGLLASSHCFLYRKGAAEYEKSADRMSLLLAVSQTLEPDNAYARLVDVVLAA